MIRKCKYTLRNARPSRRRRARLSCGGAVRAYQPKLYVRYIKRRVLPLNTTETVTRSRNGRPSVYTKRLLWRNKDEFCRISTPAGGRRTRRAPINYRFTTDAVAISVCVIQSIQTSRVLRCESTSRV